MRRLLALVAVSFAAACAGDGSYQVWVVNERAEPVVVVIEILTEDMEMAPDETPLDYTIPAGSEACTYCGTGSLPRLRLLVYTATDCVQLGATTLIGENAYVITVPAEGLVIMEAGRPPDRSRGSQIQPIATACG
jgi:hypothetical protein